MNNFPGLFVFLLPFDHVDSSLVLILKIILQDFCDEKSF